MSGRKADILDLWSIARLKAERIGDPASTAHLTEMAKAKETLPGEIGALPTEDWALLLYQINAAIWQAEASMKGAKDALPNEHALFAPENRDELIHIGFAAIMIRNFNALRCRVKNMLAQAMNEPQIDGKKDHMSATAGDK